MGTVVPNHIYECMMSNALKIKPSKRETRFNDHLTAKNGMRTTVRYSGGFLYDGKSIVQPLMSVNAMSFVPVSTTGAACMTQEDPDLHSMIKTAINENATGKHYRNHTITVRLPHCRTAC